ncbi:MAG TPA: glycosyltransferase family 39 protein [Terriglobales bacterium]
MAFASPKFVWRAVLLSFLIQVAAIGVTHSYRFRTTDSHFAFGWEMGCIGRSLAEGRGFSDPFCVPSGPSAWEPPLYPYLIGGLFRLLGVYSNASAWVLLSINSLFASFTCVPIYTIARKLFGDVVARWSVWTWALLPYTWYWSIHWPWDTTISPFLLASITAAALDLEEESGVKGWVTFGALWGILALCNPSTLSFLPCCGLWICFRRWRRGLGMVRGPVLASLVFLLCVGPWLARNYVTFGRLVFIRDDFGQQLRLGNGPYAGGISMAYLQPNLNPSELARFRSMGELAYAEQRKREAWQFIRDNPGRFLAISLKRVVYYWADIPQVDTGRVKEFLRTSSYLASSVLALWGLLRALRKRKPGAGLLGLLVLSFPAIYYVVYPHPRYRHVIEPELLIFAVFLVSETETAPGRRAAASPEPTA